MGFFIYTVCLINKGSYSNTHKLKYQFNVLHVYVVWNDHYHKRNIFNHAKIIATQK